MTARFFFIASITLCFSLIAAERNEVRVLYDFEEPSDLKDLGTEHVVLDLVQDNGVTRGKNCARAVFKQGVDYATLELGKSKIKDWRNFDYFAIDIFSDREEKIQVSFELFDALSKNYATRFTQEQSVRHGKQTLLFKINQPKRNGKEGRDWNELEPKDKIDLNALTKVKFFFTPPKNGGDLVWWIDNIRVLQEDALGGKMKLALPEGAKAFDFGPPGSLVEGFTSVPADAKFAEDKGFGLISDRVVKLANVGKHWPDPLSGDGVYSPDGMPFAFELKIPDGNYNVWLSAGPVLRDQMKGAHFLLKVGSETIIDENVDTAELHGEKWLYRFLKTQYSERPNALWNDYIDRMYPSYERKVTVTGGKLHIDVCGHWLASMIVLPADKEDAFKKLLSDIRTERQRIFYSQLTLDPQKKPVRGDKDGAYIAFVPDDTTKFTPSTAPNNEERKRSSYELAGAPGQRVVFRLGVTPFEDLGKCSLTLSDLKGPSDIQVSAAKIFFQDYRVHGTEVRESALIPSSELNVEKGVSSCFWIWMKIPDDAKAGDYSGTVTLNVANGKPVALPIALKVYPFKLEDNLPYSFGMYYNQPQVPDGNQHRRVVSEQLAFMREVGFTAVPVGGGTVREVNEKNHTVDVKFDTFMYELAKQAGMGKNPAQMMMANSLGGARGIARKVDLKVDQRPGIEVDWPPFKPLYIDYAKKFAAFIKEQNLPTAVEIVDEPREVPNPWNRNLEHTNIYGDWLKEAGIQNRFVTPMGDSQSGKDYTSLIDHSDIISTHAGKGSEKLMRMTPDKGKTLWLYNTGMDRLSWGFYNWRVGSTGRWEWHFCFIEGEPDNGYINQEWYNPFCGKNAFAPYAPYSKYPGAMLFQSVFLTCSEGINDSAYLITLEKAMKEAQQNPAKAQAVTDAGTLLMEIRNAIPFLPDVKGVGNEAEGALVGTGIDSNAARNCETWRRKIAEKLIELKK